MGKASNSFDNFHLIVLSKIPSHNLYPYAYHLKNTPHFFNNMRSIDICNDIWMRIYIHIRNMFSYIRNISVLILQGIQRKINTFSRLNWFKTMVTNNRSVGKEWCARENKFKLDLWPSVWGKIHVVSYDRLLEQVSY